MLFLVPRLKIWSFLFSLGEGLIAPAQVRSLNLASRMLFCENVISLGITEMERRLEELSSESRERQDPEEGDLKVSQKN